MSWGNDHDHADLNRAIDEVRWDGQRDIRELEDRMHAMRAELSDWIRTEVAGLSEWIRDQAEHTHKPVPAKDGGA